MRSPNVVGVRVGHKTLIEGDGPLRVGTGPVRTGVTVILPPGVIWDSPVFAGCHRLNGNGELTGVEWIRESGMLTSPIGLTNTHSVGVVRDALIAHEVRERGPDAGPFWALPVVGETWDGLLNDLNGFHVRPEHVHEAISSASAGPLTEGSLGSGTGMICHGFKGGIGTSSRVRPREEGGSPSESSSRRTTAAASAWPSTVLRSAAISVPRRCHCRSTLQASSPDRARCALDAL